MKIPSVSFRPDDGADRDHSGVGVNCKLDTGIDKHPGLKDLPGISEFDLDAGFPRGFLQEGGDAGDTAFNHLSGHGIGADPGASGLL